MLLRRITAPVFRQKPIQLTNNARRSLSTRRVPDGIRQNRFLSFVVDNGFLVAGILFGGHIFVSYFYDVTWTWGISMVPTLASDGDCVLISKYYHHGRGIKVGDIISFKHPLREDTRASKRVIGMPGDFVLRDTPGKGKGMMIQVPKGHCWVVGDNLEHSRDSRMFGPLPLALVRGKVIARVGLGRFWWPYLEKIPDAMQPFHDWESEVD